MGVGSFKIPLDDYYTKSKEIKGKVTELKDNVQSDFIERVGQYIGNLDARDQTNVESLSSYISAKEGLETLTEHETKLQNMSQEGASNPLHSVVELDEEYSTIFSNIAKGVDSPQVAQALETIQISIKDKELTYWVQDMANQLGDNDLAQCIFQLAQTNPAQALEKLLGNEDFLNIISKDGNVDDFFWKVMTFLDDMEDIPKAFSNFVTTNDVVTKILSRLPLDKQDDILNALVKASEGSSKVFNAIVSWINAKGNIAEWLTKLAGSKPAQIISKFANTGLGKVITAPWFMAAGTGAVSTVVSFCDPKDAAHGDPGKALVGGLIDGIASVGPIDGALIGAQYGGHIGAAVGFGIGLLSQTAQFFFPDGVDQIKKGAYDLIDKGRKFEQKIYKKIGQFFSGASESISTGYNQFTYNISDAGQKANKLLSNISNPSLSWFG